MDWEFPKVEEELEAHAKEGDVDEFWRKWSKAVEKAWTSYLKPEKEVKKQITGRGKVTIVNKIPTTTAKSDKEIWNKWYYKAVDKLRQARRCDQIAYRIQKYHGDKDDEDKKAKYQQLNKEAWSNISKNYTEMDDEEKDFVDKMAKRIEKNSMNMMDVPAYKRQALHYHKKHDAYKVRSAEETARCRQKLYEAKGTGQWALSRDLGRKAAAPLLAVRRPKAGPRGQPKGTITTSPKEVDQITRDAYGKIYKGNVKNQEETAKRYIEEYKQYIYTAAEASIEDITGEDLAETLQTTAETAAGLDQWAPADLKFLSAEALDKLAMLFNAIEKNHKWPKEMKKARAACMAKDAEDVLEPLSYRALLMPPSAYRLWSRTRLRHLTPWVQDWATPEMYAGVPGRGAADASYRTALVMEVCKLKGVDYTGGAADIYKCFDQLVRPIIYKLLAKAGIPKDILGAYKKSWRRWRCTIPLQEDLASRIKSRQAYRREIPSR